MWEVSNKDQIVSNTNSMDFISIKRAPILLIFNAVNISKLMTFDAGQDLSFQAPGDSIIKSPQIIISINDNTYSFQLYLSVEYSIPSILSLI